MDAKMRMWNSENNLGNVVLSFDPIEVGPSCCCCCDVYSSLVVLGTLGSFPVSVSHQHWEYWIDGCSTASQIDRRIISPTEPF